MLHGMNSTAIAISIGIMITALTLFLVKGSPEEINGTADSSQSYVMHCPHSLVIFLRILLAPLPVICAIMFVRSLADTSGSTFWIPWLFFFLLSTAFAVPMERYVATTRITVDGERVHVVQRFGMRRYSFDVDEIGSWRYLSSNALVSGKPQVRVKNASGRTLFTVRYAWTNADIFIHMLQQRFPGREKKRFWETVLR